jgi:precorrin-4 methylase
MGLGRIRETCDALLTGGRAPRTPAAVVSRATLPGERIVIGTLADIASRIHAAGIESPALLVVGEVIAHRVESPARQASARPEDGDEASVG